MYKGSVAQKEYDKEWKRLNPDKVRATARRYYERHKEQRHAKAKQWRVNNRDKVRVNNHIYKLRAYGLTVEQYDQMMQDQGGGCAICGLKEKRGTRLHVDHVHDTGKVRGLLCTNHNVAIGMLQDNVELIKRVIAYIEAHQ